MGAEIETLNALRREAWQAARSKDTESNVGRK